MRKILVFVLLIALVFPTGATFAKKTFTYPVPLGNLAQGWQSGGENLAISFQCDPDGLQIFRGKLMLENARLTSEPGKPQVPFFIERAKVPHGFIALSASIVEVDWKRMPLPKLEPYMPKYWGDRDFYAPQENKVRGLFPNIAGAFEAQSGFDGNYATVVFNPVVLDYDTETMIVAENARLQVSLERAPTISSTNEDGESKETPKKSIIICPEQLNAAARKLLMAQKADGYEVEIVNTEWIKGNIEPQKEEPKKIKPFDKFREKDKLYLKNYDYDLAKRTRGYLSTKIEEVGYVTLIGDGTLVPPSFYYLEYMTNVEYDQYVPTDIFYASPDLDLMPNIALGRLPARNLGEANKMVDKVVAYRKSISPESFHSISLMGGDPFSGGFEGELENQALIDAGFLDGFKVKKCYKSKGQFDAKSTIEAFSKETGVIYSVTHGAGDEFITEPGKVSTSDVFKLPARPNVPILISGACSNGMYDAALIDHKFDKYKDALGLSFGQACLLSPGGPAAYFGGSRLNLAGINWTLEGGVVKALPFQEIDRILLEVMNSYFNWGKSLGELVLGAHKKYSAIAEEGYFSTPKTVFCFVFFGDPTIRLPQTPGGSPHRSPEVEAAKCPMTTGYTKVPILSITDANTINIKTDAKDLSCRVLDLEQDAKLYMESKPTSSGENAYSQKISHNTKSFWQYRLELPNLSELWMYYISRAKYDLVSRSSKAFYITKPGPVERFNFVVENDGYEVANDVLCEFKIDGKSVETRKFKTIKLGSGAYMSFKVEGLAEGEHTVEFDVVAKEQDMFAKDNKISKKLLVTTKETAKAACLVSYFFNRTSAKKALGIEQFNSKQFGDVPTEIATIGDDSYMGLVFGSSFSDFKSYGADTVILASPLCANPYITSTVSNLNNFVRAGGQVIGLACLFSASEGYNYPAYADLFGLDGEAKYEGEELDKVEFVNDGKSDLLSGISGNYQMTAQLCNKSPEGGWDAAIKTAQVVAKSADNSQVITTKGRTIFCSSLTKTETENDLRFLYNCFVHNLRPQPDAGIFESEFYTTPAVLTKKEGAKVSVSVVNLGNTNLSNIKVELVPFGLAKTIEALDKGQKTKLEFDVISPSDTGMLEVTAKITADGDVVPENDISTLRVMIRPKVEASKDLEITALSIADGDVLENKPQFVTGKASRNALVTCGSNVARADGAGNFALYLDPKNSAPITIRATTPDGQMAKKEVFCAFVNGGNIAGSQDKKFLLPNGTFIPDIASMPLVVIDKDPYLNMSICAVHLGLETSVSDQGWKLTSGQVSYSGTKGGNKMSLEIGAYKKEIELVKQVRTEQDGLLMPIVLLQKLGFSVDYDKGSFVVAYPGKRSAEKPVSLDPEATEFNSDALGPKVPSESDFGEPTLLSYGPLECEITGLYDFSTTKKNVYLLTSRGVERLSADSKLEATLGLPNTLASDLDCQWYEIMQGRSSYGTDLLFEVTPQGYFVFCYNYYVCIYDQSFKLVKKLDFTEEGIETYAGIDIDNKGGIHLFDGDGYLRSCSFDGQNQKKLRLFNKDEEVVDAVSSFRVGDDGKVLTIYRLGMFFGWTISLFGPDGKTIFSKTYGSDEEFSEDGVVDSEEVKPTPDAIFLRDDGNILAVYNTYQDMRFIMMDQQFKEISAKNVRATLRDVESFKLGKDGKLYSRCVYNYSKEEIYKTYLMVGFDGDYNMTPFAEIKNLGKGRNMMPYTVCFAADGDVLCSTSDGTQRFDRLGTGKENVVFVSVKGESFDDPVLIKRDGDYYVGLDISWYGGSILIADKDFVVKRVVPLMTEKPMRVNDFVTNLSKGEIYLLDASGQIAVIPSYLEQEKDPEEIKVTRTIGQMGVGKGKLQKPYCMQFVDEMFYVLDGGSNKVLVFDYEGNFKYDFAGPGKTPGKLMDPSSLCIDEQGFVWILDTEMSRITIYTKDGAYVNTIGTEGLYTTPGTIDGYKQNPFVLLNPYVLAMDAGQVVLYDYCHERVMLFSRFDLATNLTILPKNPAFSAFVTQAQAATSFVITNTGPGKLELELSCDDAAVKIDPMKFSGNFKEVKVTLDITKTAPKEVMINISGNLGKSSITLPVNIEPVDITLVLDAYVGSTKHGALRLTKAPVKKGNRIIASTKDFEHAIGLKGIAGKDSSTIYFSFGNRKLGFSDGSDKAELMVGDDLFTIDLGIMVERLSDSGFAVPIDALCSFLSCKIIKEGDSYHIISR